MESSFSFFRLHWDHESGQIRSAGFPTGETRRLESRRYDAIGSWKAHTAFRRALTP
jgi:hypothetical protein